MTTKSQTAGIGAGKRKPPTEKQLEALKPSQFPPGVSGNPGGRRAKPFTDALLRILEKKIANDPDGRALLDAIVQQLVAKASKGDLASIREVADRVEGKPLQRQEFGGPDGGPIPWASYIDRDANERRIAELENLARVRSGNSND